MGVIIELAILKFSGSDKIYGFIKQIINKKVNIIINPIKSLIIK
ncbi:hypothetical protein N499_1387 [Wolbachia pipientis wVitA]|nr:hypothetical protein N499_1387 [Wolbachia pipientis wVitA]